MGTVVRGAPRGADDAWPPPGGTGTRGAGQGDRRRAEGRPSGGQDRPYRGPVAPFRGTYARGATITLSWNGNTRANSYELHGSNGRARLHNGRLDLTTPERTRTWTTEDHSAGGHTHHAWTAALHQIFLDHIGAPVGGQPPWNTAVHVAEILRAAQASAAADQQQLPL
jgi:predicted dehydrogenase